jgi:hypothetical protein
MKLLAVSSETWANIDIVASVDWGTSSTEVFHPLAAGF